MKIFTMPQYSPEWWRVRCGIPTASEFDRIITPKTEEPSKGFGKYINDLIADRVNPEAPFFTNRSGHTQAMRNGIDFEPDARRFYSAERDVDVKQVGFCLSDDGRFGCSPDGVVGESGILELKCPEAPTQVGYLRGGTLPDAYRAQVHGQLIVTERKWVDFLSYCPSLDPLLIRVEPDEYTEKLRLALEAFYDEYNEASLRVLKKPAPGFRANPEAIAQAKQAFAEWLDRIGGDLDKLNAGMAGLKDFDLTEPVRVLAWQEICEFCRSKGWVYDPTKKRFYAAPAEGPEF